MTLKKIMFTGLGISFLGAFSTISSADEVKITLPQLNVAEYHAPYVAVWLADSRKKRVEDIAVWYDVDMKDDEGEKWLKDLRLWWRRSGRTLDMPVDGVSGATHRPGEHTIDLHNSLSAQPAGDYILYVEAARELGGREVLEIPVSLPVTTSLSQTVNGKNELESIELTLEPK